MALSRKHCAGYSKMEKEDPEDSIHRRAQFLIYKVLEQADSRRKPSCLRIRICKLKVKIGNRLRRLRKRIMSSVSAVRVGFQLKAWKRLFGGGRQNHLVAIPHPLIK